MNTKNSKSYTKVYKAWVLLGSILLVFSALTGCKDASDSGAVQPTAEAVHPL